MTMTPNPAYTELDTCSVLTATHHHLTATSTWTTSAYSASMQNTTPRSATLKRSIRQEPAYSQLFSQTLPTPTPHHIPNIERSGRKARGPHHSDHAYNSPCRANMAPIGDGFMTISRASTTPSAKPPTITTTGSNTALHHLPAINPTTARPPHRLFTSSITLPFHHTLLLHRHLTMNPKMPFSISSPTATPAFKPS